MTNGGLGVGLALLALLGSPAAAQRPRNVLLIAVDDLRAELGCYGVGDARTPHLDRLAAQGVLFTRHYVQVPTCGASRYALLTGRSPSRSGALHNNACYGGRSKLDPRQGDGAQTLPELFRRSGYTTVAIGKISHTPDGRVFDYRGRGDGRDELPHAWTRQDTPYGAWKRGWGAFFAYAGGRHREDGGGHRDLMEFVAEADTDLPDGLIAEQAVRSLGDLAKAEAPFLLAVGFFKPHLPFVAPRSDWRAMRDVEVRSPAHPEPIESPYAHRSNEFYKYRAPFPGERPLAVEHRIEARRAYLACVRYVDRQIGQVLDALDELGLRESTTVVVWGDHGWHLGETALWGKHTPFERALRSTLIVRAPGIGKPGVTCDALVESLDVYPTLVDVCEPGFAKTAHPLDGHSLRPLLTGERPSIRSAALSYWGKAVSVRDDEYRLIVGADGASELYDMRLGPDPVADVAADHPDVVERLRAMVPQPRERR